MAIRVTRIRITNYRGVAALDTDVSERGMLIRGPNGAGKSSVLHAIQAALLGRDVAPDAIRHGEDRAEILVDLGEVSARRIITPEGQRLTVMGADGHARGKPQTLLAELVGSAPLDPLDLFLERDKAKRRKAILAALPVKLEAADIERWVPAQVRASVGLDWDDDEGVGQYAAMHGLEACTAIRQRLYDQRTAVNRDLKAAKEAVARAEANFRAMPKVEAHLSMADAGAMLQAAEGKREALWSRRTLAKQAAALSGPQRAESARLRAEAADRRKRAYAEAPTAFALAEAQALAVERRQEVERLRERLREAEVIAKSAEDEHAALRRRMEAAIAASKEADRADETAAAIETAVAAMPAAPAEEEVDAAEKAVEAAVSAEAKAHQAYERDKAQESLRQLRDEERRQGDRAGQLTTAIDTLTHAAPADLIARSGAIPGLGLSETGDITLDGVALDALCGREQMRFAVEVARRLNAKAKFLIVDGLERLDAAHMEEFVRDATRDGYQLIASRVADGDIVLEQLEV